MFMSKMFFVGQDKDDCPIKVVLSRSGNYIFLFSEDRLRVTLTANDLFIIKDEVETEREYKGIVRLYLTRLIEKMEPCFESALNNEDYVEEVTEEYAKHMRHIPTLEQTEELRQHYCDNAFKKVDYRMYADSKERKVGA